MFFVSLSVCRSFSFIYTKLYWVACSLFYFPQIFSSQISFCLKIWFAAESSRFPHSNLKNLHIYKFIGWWVGNSNGKRPYWTIQLGESWRIYNAGACTGLKFGIHSSFEIPRLHVSNMPTSLPGIMTLHFFAAGGKRNYRPRCICRVQTQYCGWSTHEKTWHFEGQISSQLGAPSFTKTRSAAYGVGLPETHHGWEMMRSRGLFRKGNEEQTPPVSEHCILLTDLFWCHEGWRPWQRSDERLIAKKFFLAPGQFFFVTGHLFFGSGFFDT